MRQLPTTGSGSLLTSPVHLLRLEGLALLIGSVTAFVVLGGAWGLLFLGFLADLSFLGSLAGPRVGAAVYNLFHSTVLPLALVGAGWFTAHPALTLTGLILLSHIGLDRTLGYGLKYPDALGHTHLSG